ncbi:MAG: 2,3-bisphosphoglycerate-independent phosphoglycerate mutase [Deltaproteobacteria bacterium]|jgi:2,3-bisphosphoglycerate-independent phosphoglycerate mutase|nr:2,3-bisphosphoglycerate-independent phosphoglycerate mutase [Deltaproteobacteria bacterium]
MQNLKPTFLLILDGWGLAPAGPGNAAKLADTPTLDHILAQPMRSNLLCSGRAVGLPDGYMGNSEVGHMNMGAGRIIYQDMTRIDLAIEEQNFGNNPVILDLLAKTKARGGAVHFMGLLSDKGVHSHLDHLFALLDAAKANQVKACVHAFMDGRDSSPTSGAGYMESLLDKLAALNSKGPMESGSTGATNSAGQADAACLASFVGRYYAMDRDKRWDRVKQAWELLTQGSGELVTDPVFTLRESYAAGETDEFIRPRLLLQPNGEKIHIRDHDAVFFFNFRADRARQLIECFYSDDFTAFERGTRPQLSALASMTQYDEHMAIPAAFAPEEIRKVLGEVVSSLGVKQLRLAETEKYAHVTYFFNGGREEIFPGEERRLVPSPRDVATYDLKPQMSAVEVKNTLIAEWKEQRYPFVVCNFANPDMVGHTGVIPAAIKAMETVDACVREVWDFALDNGCRLLVTADHGNVEEMLTPDGQPMTSHTLNKVPFVILDPELDCKLSPEGKLGDIAPTILDLWGVEKPVEMSGVSLLL